MKAQSLRRTVIEVFLTAVTVAAFLVLSDRRGPASATATTGSAGRMRNCWTLLRTSARLRVGTYS